MGLGAVCKQLIWNMIFLLIVLLDTVFHQAIYSLCPGLLIEF